MTDMSVPAERQSGNLAHLSARRAPRIVTGRCMRGTGQYLG